MVDPEIHNTKVLISEPIESRVQLLLFYKDFILVSIKVDMTGRAGVREEELKYWLKMERIGEKGKKKDLVHTIYFLIRVGERSVYSSI